MDSEYVQELDDLDDDLDYDDEDDEEDDEEDVNPIPGESPEVTAGGHCVICNSLFGTCLCWAAHSVATRDWNLPDQVDLVQKAAQFYCLYELVTVHDVGWDEFAEVVAELAETFANYADMIVGGELRHTPKMTEYPPNNLLMRTLRSDRWRGVGRFISWSRWKTFRQQHGTDALQQAIDCFGSKRCGFGGKAWGNIAEVLMLYEQETISPVFFIDLAFGLQHNGGRFFDKLWPNQLRGLDNLLTNARNGRMDKLVAALPQEIKKTWEDKEWLGLLNNSRVI